MQTMGLQATFCRPGLVYCPHWSNRDGKGLMNMSQRTRWSPGVLFLCGLLSGCRALHGGAAPQPAVASKDEFPAELVDFVPYEKNPVFTSGAPGQWDEILRERGYILKEADGYHLWYTGSDRKHTYHKLGYATSPDGFVWTREANNPIFSDRWVEDMNIIPAGGTYHMFAEGLHDRAQLLTSTDKVHWTPSGTLDIRHSDGTPLSEGPFGTPAAWLENDLWYLFFERDDKAVWLATSKDMKVWTQVQDDPVFIPGPEPYDKFGIAWNQIIRHKGRYYAYYHGASRPPMSGWCVNVAVSPDLVHWKKYPGNPLLPPHASSGILVHDGQRYRLYVMGIDDHRVDLYLPRPH